MQGKTKSGFKYVIDERIKEDWRLLQAITDSESEDASVQLKGVSNLVNLVLGKNKEAFFKHISDNNDGYVPTTVVMAEITEMLEGNKSLKN